MDKWEYTQRQNIRAKEMNELGEQGWELAGAISGGPVVEYTFKRKKMIDTASNSPQREVAEIER